MNLLAGQESLNLISTIRRMINNSCIVDFGIVQNVPSEGLVDVSVAVSKTKQDMQIMTCILANPASSSLTMYIKPNVGDRVIVLYPRLFDSDMFTVDDAKKQEVIVNSQAKGYNLASGIAILMNQYKEASHKNFLNLDDGKLTLKLAYDKDNDKNLLTLETNENGEVSINSNDNTLDFNKDGELSVSVAYDADNDKHLLTLNTDKNGAVHLDSNEGKFKFDVDNADGDISTKVTCNDATADINKDSEITVTNPKASAKIDKDGAVTITSNTNTKINIDKNGNITLEAKGKISLKNSSANLFSILDGMLNILNTSLATAGSPASHTVVPSQFQAQQTQLGQLMQ